MGAIGAFMGMGMAQNAGGAQANGLFGMGAAPQNAAPTRAACCSRPTARPTLTRGEAA